ncbi:MAG TPA: hypothetical protein VHZ76_05570 [Gammaproteobacteria bacterium]|jgi:hypothetical protein|nr:hypothetical protein [Gammaproteobacteria bacterium]
MTRLFLLFIVILLLVMPPGWAVPTPAATMPTKKSAVSTTKSNLSKPSKPAKKLSATKVKPVKPVKTKKPATPTKPIKPAKTTKKITPHQPVGKTRFSATPINRTALATSIRTVEDTHPPLSIKQRLANFIHKTIATLHHSTYKLGGSQFDATKGIYVIDCSRYVGRILQTIYPHAYSSLVRATRVDGPASQHYYDFFTQLDDHPKHYWNKINSVDELETGDILVFRYKNRVGNETGGHVMIVMNKPMRDKDVFLVQITDSAASGHSQDTRLPRVSGIGIGTLLLKVNPMTDEPYAFAWRVGSKWEKNVSIAMARPIGGYAS